MSDKQFNIRLAEIAELEDIYALYRACTVKMNRAGLFNWHDTYPDREIISTDILSGTLYIIETDRIQGAVALNDDQPPEYREILWEYHVEPYLVVHRLAIDPLHQGKGYARKMMLFTEELARTNGCPSIRMDVFTINTPGRNLYKSLNYKELNEFYFPGIDTRFIGLEKKIG